MSFIHDSGSNENIFLSEVLKSIEKTAKKHGYDAPNCNVLLGKDGALYMNLSIYPGKAEDHYEKMYRKYASEIGMDLSWLGTEVFNKEKTKKYKLLGIDPDGGKDCLRIRDDNNVDHHISPQGFTYLMLN